VRGREFITLARARGTGQPPHARSTHERTCRIGGNMQIRDYHVSPRLRDLSTLFHRTNAPGKVGRMMQTWVRLDEGWRIVVGHVSVVEEPVS
jgi:AtzH-like